MNCINFLGAKYGTLACENHLHYLEGYEFLNYEGFCSISVRIPAERKNPNPKNSLEKGY